MVMIVGKSLVYFGKDVLALLELLVHRRTTIVHDRSILVQQTGMATRRIRTFRTVISKNPGSSPLLNAARMTRSSYVLACVLGDEGEHCNQGSNCVAQAFVREKDAKFRSGVIKIQSHLKMKTQVGKYHGLLSERKEQDDMETAAQLLKKKKLVD
ncbi:hypothetical protein P3T76_007441 [Phytophthora citrophthora]|uniref:Uncharacterized protein n=1 Tax=Phytophthora citrophthora TaxID=4793 RepID=A0AAD9GMX7_9STRA|nr:hypothetical protein P3T76_007441 [Phytophthora citrophthora]